MTITPTDEQQRVLDLGPTSIRVRAGAGTGKTTTVALVIANLVANHGIDPERILGMTFTNKAAAELADRVAEMLPSDIDPARQVEIHTYHGFAAQVLSEFGVLAGVETRAGVITPTFARQIIRDVFNHTGYRHIDMTNRQTMDQIKRLGDQLGDHLLRPDDVIKAAAINAGDDIWAARLEMAETLARYNEAKTELKVVDYSDLVTLSTKVFTEHPALAETVRDRYRVLVLDEYQDTNPAQRVLIQTIFSGGFPVVAVGDEDQTIYEWRGASAENFELFLEHFKTANGSQAHDAGLTLNRRSGRKILSIANEIRRTANPGADDLTPAGTDDAEVTTYWARDALAEAEWIARQFETLHDRGASWSDMAVLFRKNKDFAIVVDVLGRHDIPLEVANVGGLLSVPEISFVRAWLTVLQSPDDSTALAQILFGSTYRLGIADLGVLTRWLTASLVSDEDAENPEPVTLVEAIERADHIEGLSDQARQRLSRFHRVYRDLLVETQGVNLAETCRLILDRTNAWADVESLPPNPRLTARLNLYRFLDLADDWSPLSGRSSVAAFLDYLLAMEDEPAEELDSARLSGEDAVTLVTVHRAKGLEWENVAIPAVVHDNFPSRSGAFPDPDRFAYQLPIELRLDTAVSELPDDSDGRKAFFRERHRYQEWRVAYVAATRAKKRLFVSGAYWYGLPEPRLTPAKPSELFELVESHRDSVSDGHVDEGPRPAVLRTPDDAMTPDPLFIDGWQSGLRMAAEDPAQLERMADAEGVRREYDDLVATNMARLFELDDTEDGTVDVERSTVSVTGLVTYAQCPKRFFWTDVDPLPRKRNAAALRGSEIHRRIELHQLGQVPFEDFSEDLYDDVVRDGDGVGAYEAYEGSRFAGDRAALVEAPFTVTLDNGYQVRGRIDAVYADGKRWEIVDFKSGRRKDDPARIVQLQAYAVAADDVDFALEGPDELNVTFAYLGGGLDEHTEHADAEWVANARAALVQLTDRIESGDFAATPGSWCGHCDFLRFCEPGQMEMGK